MMKVYSAAIIYQLLIYHLRTSLEFCMYLWLKPSTPELEVGTDYAYQQ